jgi:hypothetical protein
VVDDVVDLRHRCGDGLVVGLDFAFSFPVWFLAERGFAEVGQLWQAAAAEGEEWLSRCDPPFWGRPTRRRPALEEHLRRCERSARVGGITAKSVFHIHGPGTVGTGSIRGMPHLLRLRAAGFSMWPFDPPSPWKVVEIYPRLLTGPVHKSNAAHRARYLTEGTWAIGAGHAASIAGSEDAFDAAISALVMHGSAAGLTTLGQASDPVTLLEGDIWPPRNITS